ncbi:MAG TPA: hypothetical protein VF798_05100, partial [Burkholderiaceae bacterium]
EPQMRISSLVLAAAFALAPEFSFAAEQPSQAKADIEQVVDTFKAAIIRHDGQGLKELFLPDHGNWLSVIHEELYRKVVERNPEAQRINPSTYASFADFVTHAKEPVEERFYNVRIETNGTIGIVYFNFDFLEGGKIENRGDETWQLIKTDKGWKIAAMLYSSQGA